MERGATAGGCCSGPPARTTPAWSGLEGCEFIDSNGIALFLQVHRQLENEGGRLVIYGCSDQVLRIFTVAGLTDVGIVFDSRGEAIAELAAVD